MTKLTNEVLDLLERSEKFSIKINQNDADKSFKVMEKSGIDFRLPKEDFYIFDNKGDLEDAVEIFNKKKIRIIDVVGLD
jgi:hypothetical protein